MKETAPKELWGGETKKAVENTATGELVDVECDALILLLGFHSHLGSIADWGLVLHGKRQILVEPKTMETSLPGVYAAGDVAGYEGKITLISVGFGEAAIAANYAIAAIRGEKVQPKYSTDLRGHRGLTPGVVGETWPRRPVRSQLPA